jgi:hypothetical protein
MKKTSLTVWERLHIWYVIALMMLRSKIWPVAMQTVSIEPVREKAPDRLYAIPKKPATRHRLGQKPGKKQIKKAAKKSKDYEF